MKPAYFRAAARFGLLIGGGGVVPVRAMLRKWDRLRRKRKKAQIKPR